MISNQKNIKLNRPITKLHPVKLTNTHQRRVELKSVSDKDIPETCMGAVLHKTEPCDASSQIKCKHIFASVLILILIR